MRRTDNRYDRQMRIPGWDQSKLKRARVFIAGMGALGNEVAKNLALAGVGNLLLIDFDCIEYTNLNRTVLFTAEDVGSRKVEAASRSIHRLSPSTRVKTFGQTLQELLERKTKVLQDVDLLVGCLDNREARFILNHISVARRIPYVDGGMFNAMGSVRVSVPPYTPCLECGIPESTYAQIGQRYRCEDLAFDDLTAQQMAVRHPTISTVTSVTGAIQSHEALKILLGLQLFRKTGTWVEGVGKPIENEIQYDCRTNSFLVQSVRREIDCYVCGTRGTSIDPVEPISLSVTAEDRIADIVSGVRAKIGTESFNLVKGLNPFPNRTVAVAKARNLFQRLQHVSRILAKSASSVSHAQECYRILRTCLESDRMTRARQTLRRGIPFSPNDLVAAMQLINDTIESISLRAQTFVPELKLMLDEIAGDVSSALHWLSNDLSAGECQLQDKSILSAIRDRQGLLNDISIEVALRA